VTAGSKQAEPLAGSGARLVLPGLSMIAVTYGLARFSYGLFLPQFRTAFELNATLLGLIAGGSYAGYCVAIMLSSALSPRLGPRSVVVLAGVVAAAGMCLVAAASGGAALAAGVLIAGMSTGLASPPMGDTVRRRIVEQRQGPANTWINSGTSLGVLVSGPVVLLAGADWRVAWLAFAAAALLVTGWCALTLPGRASADRPSAPPRERLSPLRWFTRRSAPLLAAAAAMGLVSSVYWTFSRDLIVHAGFSPTASTGFWMVIGVAGFAGGLAGRFVQHRGLTFALRTSLVGFGTAIAVLSLAPGTAAVVFTSAAVFGALYIMLTGIFLVWSVAVFDQRPSLGIALSFATIAVGQLIGSALAGATATLAGTGTAFWLFAIVCIGSALIRPHRDQTRHFDDLATGDEHVRQGPS